MIGLAFVIAAYRKTRETKEVSLLESDRRAERDRDQQQRLERKAAREQAGDKDEHKDEPKPDSGLDPGEQPVTDNRDSDDDAKGKPDLLLTETAHVLSDAIVLLEGNRALASRVKGFTLADNKRLN